MNLFAQFRSSSVPCPSRESRRRFCLALAGSLVWIAGGTANAQTPDPHDYRIITQVPREELDRWIKEETARSGGNFDRDRYHFVVGFSTGHFGSDPVHAIAMRRLAFSLLNNTLAVGDRVTPVAWEMSVWDRGKPIRLTEEPQSRAHFVDAVPYAPMANSRGGHDTERALYETLTQVVPQDQAASTIILLLTNTNQSQGPTGERVTLFGANNPQLSQALRRLGYRNPIRHSFRAESKSGPLTVDATALFPQKLRSLPDAPGTDRYPTFAMSTWQPPADRPETANALPNPVQSDSGAPVATGETAAGTPAAAPEQKGFPWPWLLLGLLLLGAVAFFLLRKRGQPGAAAEKVAAPGRPIPGAIKATLGSAPYSRTQMLTSLNSAGRWLLVLNAEQRPGLVEVKPGEETVPTDSQVLASLSFDERRRLLVDAEPNVVFQSVTGVKPDTGNPRRLVLSPRDHLVCRVAPSSTQGDPTRLELAYQEKA